MPPPAGTATAIAGARTRGGGAVGRGHPVTARRRVATRNVRRMRTKIHHFTVQAPCPRRRREDEIPWLVGKIRRCLRREGATKCRTAAGHERRARRHMSEASALGCLTVEWRSVRTKTDAVAVEEFALPPGLQPANNASFECASIARDVAWRSHLWAPSLPSMLHSTAWEFRSRVGHVRRGCSDQNCGARAGCESARTSQVPANIRPDSSVNE